MKSLLSKSYLFVAGLIMMLIGIYIAITTQDYMSAMTAQYTQPSVNMLSDLRGMGGMLLVLGLYVFVTTFRSLGQQSALMIATTVYASFVLFRSLSMALDGLPETTILIAYTIELCLAAVGVGIIKGKVLN